MQDFECVRRPSCAVPPDETSIRPGLPAWVGVERGAGLDGAAFASGAALALLDRALADPDGGTPGALLRDRLALQAAEACLRFEFRRASQAEIRDAVCLVRAGDAPGPAGAMFDRWRRVGRIDLRLHDRADRLAALIGSGAAAAADPGRLAVPPGASPVRRAAAALSAVLRAFPREEASALIVADVALAEALGWRQPLPLLAGALTRRDLAALIEGEEGVAGLHRAATQASGAALRFASDLQRRATRLRAVAPKLRAKGAGEAVRLFLTEDALSPSADLAPVVRGSSVAMTDRAARRLCDRLVALGAVRELTGRPTFRLYGL